MDRSEVLQILKAHESEFRAAGIESMSLFGSMARGEEAPGDIDVAIKLAKNFTARGWEYFGRLDDLEKQLAEMFQCNVDLIAEPHRKERFQKEIDRDRALAF